MGGSAKQVVKKVETETKNVGRGVVHGGTQLAEGTKKMVNTTAAGLEGAGKALPGAIEGMGKGLGKMGMDAVDGLSHNLGQVANVIHGIMGSGPSSGGGNSGAQSSSANYSQQGKRSRSGAQKRGDLASQERKGATGKQKLYARRKTA